MGNIKIKEYKKNLAQETYRILRERIYTNEIKPGDIINENSLSKELGISRTPIREAIRMLASEDIIDVRDGVGNFVKILSIKDIKDIFEVRKALEVIAVKNSIYKIPLEKVLKLENTLNELLKKCQQGILIKEEFSDMDMAVHKLILDYCDNKYVKSIFEGMELRIKQYQFISYENFNDSKESIVQHIEILKLLKEKDLENIIIMLENHVDWALKILLT